MSDLLGSLQRVKERKTFIDKMLLGIRYKGLHKEIIRIELQDRLNSEIIVRNKKVLNSDSRKDIEKIVCNIENNLKVNATYHKIKNNKLSFVTFDGQYFKFDLVNLSNNTSMQDIEVVIEEMLIYIFQNKLINVINEVNRLSVIKSFYTERYIIKLIINKIKSFFNIIKLYFHYILIFIILSFITYICLSQKFVVKPQTQQTVSIALMGLVATFSGFAVVFVQLSFDNYKKYYGYYSKVLLFKSLGKEIIVLFSLNIAIQLLCSSIEENYTYYINDTYKLNIQRFTFCLSLVFFLYFLILLMYKVRYIFDFSLSNNFLPETIKKIDINNIKHYLQVSKNFENTRMILRNFENNYVEIISDIVINYVNQSNYKTSEVIIIELTNHFQSLIINSSNNSIVGKNSDSDNIIIVYYEIMRKAIDSINYTNHRELVSVFNYSLNLIAYYSSIKGCNANALRSMLDAFKSAFKVSLNTSNNDVIFSWFNFYKASIMSLISYNTPFLNVSRPGTPYMAQTKRELFRDSSSLYSVLGELVAELYNSTLSSINDDRKISIFDYYNFISTYREFLEKNILYNHNKYLRSSCINLFSINLIDLYINAYKKMDFNNLYFPPYESQIYKYSPINVHVLESSIIYDTEDISVDLLNSYIVWCQFIIDNNDNVDLISELVDEIIFLLYRLFFFINEQESSTDKSILAIEVTKASIDKIIDVFYLYPHKKDESRKKLISEIHNRFWQFLEFEYIRVGMQNDSFTTKLKFIVDETKWANTH